MATENDYATLINNIKDDVASIGRKYGLKLILLHGSFAAGTATSESDLDIVILGRSKPTVDQFMKIHHEFAQMLADIDPARELDLTTLHRADPLFCFQVAQKSLLLYGTSDDYHEFLSYAFKFYMDSGDLFELERTQVLKFQKYLNEKYLSDQRVVEHHAD